MGLWRRLKLQAKCSLDKKRNINKGTGGGPPGSPITTIEENVIAVLGDSAEPLENPYDDEGGYAEEIPLTPSVSCHVIICWWINWYVIIWYLSFKVKFTVLHSQVM
ncbi:hypothetical protein ANN_27962 [Periplaneta americana]|uniref:Uncharacterized protein n=1 Tax=Periplaneta americana TaxID=6978 RepID=A0ABQ8RUK7_PERAM|nr:hypothetical protein ANN_27962 [Periplaneta americana]